MLLMEVGRTVGVEEWVKEIESVSFCGVDEVVLGAERESYQTYIRKITHNGEQPFQCGGVWQRVYSISELN